MAGLRGQDEIEKAFADLEYLPGSKKKKRREEIEAKLNDATVKMTEEDKEKLKRELE